MMTTAVVCHILNPLSSFHPWIWGSIIGATFVPEQNNVTEYPPFKPLYDHCLIITKKDVSTNPVMFPLKLWNWAQIYGLFWMKLYPVKEIS